eukprot:2376390-Rhodomonas_salina.1
MNVRCVVTCGSSRRRTCARNLGGHKEMEQEEADRERQNLAKQGHPSPFTIPCGETRQQITTRHPITETAN